MSQKSSTGLRRALTNLSSSPAVVTNATQVPILRREAGTFTKSVAVGRNYVHHRPQGWSSWCATFPLGVLKTLEERAALEALKTDDVDWAPQYSNTVRGEWEGRMAFAVVPKSGRVIRADPSLGPETTLFGWHTVQSAFINSESIKDTSAVVAVTTVLARSRNQNFSDENLDAVFPLAKQFSEATAEFDAKAAETPDNLPIITLPYAQQVRSMALLTDLPSASTLVPEVATPSQFEFRWRRVHTFRRLESRTTGKVDRVQVERNHELRLCAKDGSEKRAFEFYDELRAIDLDRNIAGRREVVVDRRRQRRTAGAEN